MVETNSHTFLNSLTPLERWPGGGARGRQGKCCAIPLPRLLFLSNLELWQVSLDGYPQLVSSFGFKPVGEHWVRMTLRLLRAQTIACWLLACKRGADFVFARIGNDKCLPTECASYLRRYSIERVANQPAFAGHECVS